KKAIITFGSGVIKDTIKCNTFLKNQTPGGPKGGIIYMDPYNPSTGKIIKNIFDGNSCTLNTGISILNIKSQGNDTLEFANNLIRNNSPGFNGTACYIYAYVGTKKE